MNNDLKIRLAKLRELAERGATEGEKNAALKGMERLIKKLNLDEQLFLNTGKMDYTFRYTTNLEVWLLIQITDVLVEISYDDKIKSPREKMIYIKLNYLDYITIECAYEYFRRHMKKEWNRTAIPELKKCRKASTRNKKRAALQKAFFSEYAIASGLVKPFQIEKVKLTSQEDRKRARLFRDIEGGKYNQQVNNGLYLEDVI